MINKKFFPKVLVLLLALALLLESVDLISILGYAEDNKREGNRTIIVEFRGASDVGIPDDYSIIYIHGGSIDKDYTAENLALFMNVEGSMGIRRKDYEDDTSRMLITFGQKTADEGGGVSRSIDEDSKDTTIVYPIIKGTQMYQVPNWSTIVNKFESFLNGGNGNSPDDRKQFYPFIETLKLSPYQSNERIKDELKSSISTLNEIKEIPAPKPLQYSRDYLSKMIKKLTTDAEFRPVEISTAFKDGKKYPFKDTTHFIINNNIEGSTNTTQTLKYNQPGENGGIKFKFGVNAPSMYTSSIIAYYMNHDTYFRKLIVDSIGSKGNFIESVSGLEGKDNINLRAIPDAKFTFKSRDVNPEKLVALEDTILKLANANLKIPTVEVEGRNNLTNEERNVLYNKYDFILRNTKDIDDPKDIYLVAKYEALIGGLSVLKDVTDFPENADQTLLRDSLTDFLRASNDSDLRSVLGDSEVTKDKVYSVIQNGDLLNTKVTNSFNELLTYSVMNRSLNAELNTLPARIKAIKKVIGDKPFEAQVDTSNPISVALHKTYYVNKYTGLVIDNSSYITIDHENSGVVGGDVSDATKSYWKETGTIISLMNQEAFKALMEKAGKLPSEAISDIATQEQQEDGTALFLPFYNISKAELSPLMKVGVANSATYLPLKTNVYNPFTYKSITSVDFYEKLHFKWGFNRKAILIDTRLNSVTSNYNNGTRGTTRVATLKDMLEYNKEIQLYVDYNYYNEEELNKFALTSDKFFTSTKAAGDAIIDKAKFIGEVGKDITDLSLGKLAGDLSSATVDAISNQIKELGLYTEDQLFMNKDLIKGKFAQEEYTPDRAYAITSAIYRYPKVKDIVANRKRGPVFSSSSSLYKHAENDNAGVRAMLNYQLLANTMKNPSVDYRNNLDYYAPIYLDIYGNIISQSGLVIVPAVANQTYRQDSGDVLNMAFISSYGKYEHIPAECPMDEQWFKLGEDGTKWYLKKQMLNDNINLEQLAFERESTISSLTSLAHRGFITEDGFSQLELFRNVTLEAMRGAPIDKFDPVEQGLVTEQERQFAINQAAKLEDLRENITPTNGINFLEYPNIAFLDNYDWFVARVFEIAVIAAIALIVLLIFIGATKQKLDAMKIVSIIISVFVSTFLIISIPKIMQESYYGTNKLLLQKETETLQMLNTAKRYSSYEVGISDVKVPKRDSKLYITVDNLNVNIMKMLMKVFGTDKEATVREFYKEAAQMHELYGHEGIEFRENKVLIDYDHILETSNVLFDVESKTLFQYTKGDTYPSHYTPYYVYMDNLLGRINRYNAENGIYQYVPYTLPDGRITTLGLITPYLESEDFLNINYDPLNLNLVFDTMDYREGQVDDLNADADLKEVWAKTFRGADSLKGSDWYPDESVSDATRYERVLRVNEEARKFVARNRNLIGNIPDEIFLQTMCLHLANKTNAYNMTGAADSVELYTISTEDLTRMATVDTPKLIKSVTLSYERFLYENAGVTGIYLGAILEVIYLVIYYLRPIAALVLLIVALVSVLIHRFYNREKRNTVRDILTVMALMLVINIAYAISIKLLVLLPRIGTPAGLALLVQIVVNLSFIFLFSYVIFVATKNWRDLGNQVIVSNIKDLVGSLPFVHRDRGRGENFNNPKYEDERDGWKTLDKMKSEFKRKQKDRGETEDEAE